MRKGGRPIAVSPALTMARVVSMSLVKQFRHADGRMILAFYDDDRGWLIELRPADSREGRMHWQASSEEQAVDIVFGLMGHQEQDWQDVPWR
jgi:hypothetical protein